MSSTSKTMLFLCVLVSCHFSCSGGNDGPGTEAALILSPTSITSPASGLVESFSIQSNERWSAQASAGWINISPRSGDGNGIVSVQIGAYDGVSPQTGEITVKSATLTQKISVTQQGNITGNASVQASQNKCQIPANLTKLHVQSGFTGCNVTLSDSWLRLSGGTSGSDFLLELDKNTSYKPRTAAVVVKETGGTRSHTLAVTQYGTPDLTIGDDGSRTIAFPGAEGGGRYATGGRGGKVYTVTTLEDNKLPGSFRYAVEQSGARTVVFAVSGTIHLKEKLIIRDGNITIAGQTAPGEGVCVADKPFSVGHESNNNIVRFMTMRLGDKYGDEEDSFGGRYSKNVIIDHITASWSVDECASFYANENFTMQWSLVSESLRESFHEKDAHGYGGIWGGKNASFHHNLLAHHDSRNPRVQGVSGTTYNGYSYMGVIDLRNNVTYNWWNNGAYAGEEQTINIVNCYYKAGPATTKKDRIFSPDASKKPSPLYPDDREKDIPDMDKFGRYYIDGNVVVSKEGAVNNRPTNDNWTYGVWSQLHNSYNGKPGEYDAITEAQKLAMKVNTPFNIDYTTTHDAQTAYQRVVAYAGNSLHRDAVDRRVIEEVRTGTATYSGSVTQQPGIIDKVTDVGGYPAQQSWPAWTDTDGDGIPDIWEEAYGLDKNNKEDGNRKTLDPSGRYTNLEVYLHNLVQHIVHEQNAGGTVVETKPR